MDRAPESVFLDFRWHEEASVCVLWSPSCRAVKINFHQQMNFDVKRGDILTILGLFSSKESKIILSLNSTILVLDTAEVCLA